MERLIFPPRDVWKHPWWPHKEGQTMTEISSILWEPKLLNFTEVFKQACGFRTAAKTALLLFGLNLHLEDVFVAVAHLLMHCLFVFGCGKSWTDSKNDM